MVFNYFSVTLCKIFVYIFFMKTECYEFKYIDNAS